MAEWDDGWKEEARITQRKGKNKTLMEAVHGLENWKEAVFFKVFRSSNFSTSVLSHVRLFATLWIVGRQPLLSMGILQARILEWVARPSSRGS